MSGFNDLSTAAKVFTAVVAVYLAILFPAAMIFLIQLIPAVYLYIIFSGLFLIGLLPTSLVFYKIHWDGQKFLEAQISNQPFSTFSETISKVREHAKTENEERRFEALKGTFFDKLFSAKNILFTSIAASLILLIIPILWAEFLWPLFYLALILPFKAWRGLYKDWSMLESVRNQQISRIYEILKPIMKFEVPAQYCIVVAAWEDKTIPKQINILYPPTFRGDTQQARDSFESAFSSTITEDNAWIYTWYPTKSAVVCRPVEDIPKRVEYKGSGMFKWHTFPVGVGLGDKGQEIISYSVNKNETGIYHPHVLIAGTTGSGKSVIQRNILFHCIQHNDMWRFVGIDLKKVELSKYEKYSETVKSIATTLEDGVAVLRYAYQVMNRRNDKLAAAGVSDFMELVDEETGRPDPALLVMIDEAYEFLAPSGNKSAQGKYEDELHQEAGYLLSSIARMGRSAGIHLVLATQRPDATVIKGELKNNLAVRIAAGRLDNTPSLMVLDSASATTLPEIKGRGMLRAGGQLRQFQGFYAEDNWIDNWLSKPQNRFREPALTAKMFGGVEQKTPIRVEGLEPATRNVENDNLGDALKEFIKTSSEVESPPLKPQPKFDKLEDVDNFFEDENIPAIDDSLLESEYMFEDELSLMEDDEISEEEIEELLNELAKMEEIDDPIFEPSEETNIETLFDEAEKAFEEEFQELFNAGVQKPIPAVEETIKPKKQPVQQKNNVDLEKPIPLNPPQTVNMPLKPRLDKPSPQKPVQANVSKESSDLKEQIKKLPKPKMPSTIKDPQKIDKNLPTPETLDTKLKKNPKNGFPIPQAELKPKEEVEEQTIIPRKEIPKPPTLKI
jgi:hypothetical protein